MPRGIIRSICLSLTPCRKECSEPGMKEMKSINLANLRNRSGLTQAERAPTMRRAFAAEGARRAGTGKVLA